MIEAFAVKFPTFVITWDGSLEDAKAIAEVLTPSLGDQIINLNYHAEMYRPNELWIHIYSNHGEWLWDMRASQSLSFVVDPRDGQVLAVVDRAMQQDTVVLQEGMPRAIGQ